MDRCAYAAAGAVKVDATDADTEPTTAPRRNEHSTIMLMQVKDTLVVEPKDQGSWAECSHNIPPLRQTRGPGFTSA